MTEKTLNNPVEETVIEEVAAGTGEQENDSAGSQVEKKQEATLPPGVVTEPRNEEEMHLDLITDSPELIKAYLQVSDDQGELLGDAKLEKEVIDICNQYESVDYKKIDNPEQRLKEVMGVTTKYGTQVNLVENILGGCICKSRIREGGLFCIQKDLTDEIGWIWKKWFKKNYNPTHFRSVSDYMKLAAVPGIIRYSVYGKTRLLLMLRLIEDYEDKKDPIGSFLQENDVDFDVYAETDPKELRIQTDITINKKRLEAEDLDVVPVDRVEALVRNGKELMPNHIKSLKFLKDNSGDVLKYMNEIVASDGSPEPIMSPENKAKSFKGVIDRFIKATESAFNDVEYLGKIDAEFVAQLKQKVLELEQRVTPSN